MHFDPGQCYAHTKKQRLIGRIHGRSWYAQTLDLFDMPRLSRGDQEAGGR
jgi:hypothetical protein